MPSIPSRRRQTRLNPASETTGVLPSTGAASQSSTQLSAARTPSAAPARARRHVPRIAVHNVWMAVLLVVMVGKAGELLPLISGLPVLKIAFVFTAIYFNRVSVLYAPVRVMSLPLARVAIAFLSLAAFSIVFSVYKSLTLEGCYLAAIYIITFVMVLKTTQTMKDVERLLLALAVAGSSLSIAVLLDFKGGRAHINSKFDANDLAYSLDTVLPIVLALRGRVWGVRRALVTGLALAMCMAVLLTASRGGLLGLMVVLIAVSFCPLDLAKNGQLRRRNIAAVVITMAFLAGLGTVLFAYLPGSSQEHLLTLVHPEQNYNLSTTLNSSRRVIWARDTRLALERPIGYGMGTAGFVDGVYGHGQYRTAHNSVVQAFVELGALGLYLYLASYYVAWRQLGRIRPADPRDGPDSDAAKAALYARALRIALLGNFAVGFFLSQAYSAPLWMMLAICCAFVRVAPTDNNVEARHVRPASYGWRRPKRA
jgi:O-antigen ligase